MRIRFITPYGVLLFVLACTRGTDRPATTVGSVSASQIAFQQIAASTPQSPVQTLSLAYGSAEQAGDANVIFVGWNDSTSSVTSLTDSNHNTYQLVVGPTRGTAISQSIYVAFNVAAGADTISVAFDQPAAFVDLRIVEYAGLGSVDQTAVGSGTSASASTSALNAPASGLVVAAGMTFGAFSGPGTGFTTRIITQPDTDLVEDMTVGQAGAISVTAPETSSTNWVMQAVSFFAASGAATDAGTAPDAMPAPDATSPDATTPDAGTAMDATSTGGGPAYPLRVSSNGRYLVDQLGQPFLISGDAPQSITVNLSVAEADGYFADRAAHGFNSVWINLLCDTYTAGRADGSTFDGILPFNRTLSDGNYDFSAPNPAFFQRVDAMLQSAASHGLNVLLDPAETGGWLSTMLSNGSAACRSYGQFLGNRYRSFDNIIWLSGNDFQDWRTAANDAVVTSVALGIKDVDTRHIHTVELDFLNSASTDDPNWVPIISLNAAYTYFPTYAEVLSNYNQPGPLPAFLIEGVYEFESNAQPQTASPSTLRRQIYWTNLSGGTGQIYGNHYTWTFTSGWQNFLDSPGAQQMPFQKAFFESRRWFDLVPDQNHTVVTAGFGTFTNSGAIDASDYTTAARTPDGSLVIAYLPTIRTITVDMTSLGAAATAEWFDPSSGTYTPISGSPLPNTGTRQFTPAGPNGEGDPDWVLVLETSGPPPPPPPPMDGGVSSDAGSAPSIAFVQAAAATPQQPMQTVSVAFNGAQSAGNLDVVVVGWNDTTQTISAVTDSSGNAYTLAVGPTAGQGLTQAIYYAPNIHASSSNTVTVAFSGPAAFVDLRIAEYSGVGASVAVDHVASASGSAQTASAGAVTTSAPGELVFAAGITAGLFSGSGSGFTSRLITQPDGDILEDAIESAAGSFTPTAIQTGAAAWVMQAIAFR
jgi:hypothetical protein